MSDDQGSGGENVDDAAFEPTPMTSRQLAFVWERIVSRPTYLASTLHEWSKAEGLSIDQMAAELETDRDGLFRLGLSGTPRPATRRDDLRRIAEYHGVPFGKLQHIYQSIATRNRFRQATGPSNLLAAARDRQPEDRLSGDRLAEDRSDYETTIDAPDNGDDQDPEPERR